MFANLHQGIITNSAHGGPNFLGWHRVYLALYVKYFVLKLWSNKSIICCINYGPVNRPYLLEKQHYSDVIYVFSIAMKVMVLK